MQILLIEFMNTFVITILPSCLVLTRNVLYSVLYHTIMQPIYEFQCSLLPAAFPLAKISSLTDISQLVLLFNLISVENQLLKY